MAGQETITITIYLRTPKTGQLLTAIDDLPESVLPYGSIMLWKRKKRYMKNTKSFSLFIQRILRPSFLATYVGLEH